MTDIWFPDIPIAKLAPRVIEKRGFITGTVIAGTLTAVVLGVVIFEIAR